MIPGKFLDNLESFRMIWKVFDDPKSFIMQNVCNLCISLVWLCHHTVVMMLQKQHIPFWIGDQIAILCTVAKWFTHFICREKSFTHFLSRKRFTQFFWKVFVRWILPSGKFRLFGPLKDPRTPRWCVWYQQVGLKSLFLLFVQFYFWSWWWWTHTVTLFAFNPYDL